MAGIPGDKNKVLTDQPYDESVEVPDSESVASIYTPSPRGKLPGVTPIETTQKMSDDHSDDDFDAAESDRQPTELRQHGKPVPAKLPAPAERPAARGGGGVGGGTGGVRGPGVPGGGGGGGGGSGSESEEEDDEDDDDSDAAAIPGAYDPAEFEHLPVTPDIKDLFQYITRYTPQTIELEHTIKPFIPDYIPAVGDIDAFIKIPRPDLKADTLGLTVLDEPCAQQSDPTVLDLMLRAQSKQTSNKEVTVHSIDNAEKSSKAINNWIKNIGELHKMKPAPTVHYSKNMPDIDTLMQEWPSEFEEALKNINLPTADLDCSLAEYVDLVCTVLDIPVHKSRVQSLHLLFTLYTEFKNSQHFKALAKENRLDNATGGATGDPTQADSSGTQADRFVL